MTGDSSSVGTTDGAPDHAPRVDSGDGVAAHRDGTAVPDTVAATSGEAPQSRTFWANLNQPFAVGLFVFVACVQYMYPLWLFNLSFYKMFSDILTIFLLFTLCSAIAKAVSSPGKLLRRALTFVNSASYSVYLSHCLFLNLVKKFVIDAGHSKLSVVTASSAVACIVLPFAIAYAENRIRRALTRH